MVQRRVTVRLSQSTDGRLTAPEDLRKTLGLPGEPLAEDEMRGRLKEAGYTLTERGEQRMARSGPVTMSKSAGNGVPMGPFIEAHGSDVARITLLFAAPPENNMEWSDEGVGGAERFLSRLVGLFGPDREVIAAVRERLGAEGLDAVIRSGEGLAEDERSLRRRLHTTIKKVTQDTEAFAFNTAIAALMELLNEAGRHRGAAAEASPLFCATAWTLCRLLTPFAPHLAEEFHSWFGGSGSVFDAGWPEWEEAALVEDTVEIALQVNGKVRDRLVVPRDAERETLQAQALASAKVKELIGDRVVRKIIVVPGRLVNVVA